MLHVCYDKFRSSCSFFLLLADVDLSPSEIREQQPVEISRIPSVLAAGSNRLELYAENPFSRTDNFQM